MKIKNNLATCFGLNNKPSSGQLIYVYSWNILHKVSYQSSDGDNTRSSGNSSSSSSYKNSLSQ